MTRITAIVTVAAASAALAAAAVSSGVLPASAAAHPAAYTMAHPAGHRAAHPAAGGAGHSAAHRVDRQIARKMPGALIGKGTRITKGALTAPSPAQIISQYGSGQYVSVVTCQSGPVPPPVNVGKQGTPLRLSGVKPSATVTRTLNDYRPVYRCTLVVKKRIPATPGKGGGLKPCEHAKASHNSKASKCGVTLNTGFGGAAGSVSHHRPRS